MVRVLLLMLWYTTRYVQLQAYTEDEKSQVAARSTDENDDAAKRSDPFGTSQLAYILSDTRKLPTTMKVFGGGPALVFL